MKIRRSLRLYFFVSLLLIGTVTILSFSAYSVSSFLEGLNASMRQIMIDVIEHSEVEEGKSNLNLSFYISNSWDDLPVEITTKFQPEPESMYELYTHFEDGDDFGPPEKGYFFLKGLNSQNEMRYIAKLMNKADFVRLDAQTGHAPSDQKNRLIFYTLSGLVIFSIMVMLLIRKIAQPIEKLKDWAKALDKDNLQNKAPDFEYAELNTLANMIKNSLNSVQKSLDREQEFLSYASHELRTPIAVTRTNSELLTKMMKAEKNPEKQIQVIERIHRASITMTDLTETLLWLNREQGKTLAMQQVQLGELAEQLVHDLGYLLTGKKVDVEVTIDTQSFELPSMLCRIVLTNLIRNAFQHTIEGRVSIIQTGKSLYITNQNIDSAETSDDLGFGLGLQLTEKLIKQYQWTYCSEAIEGGRSISLNF